MELERLLSSVPPSQWETRQAIVFDWYDGPREGVCSLANPGGEFFFKLLDERHNPDGLDDRLFRLHEIPSGTIEQTLALLQELGEPEHTVWVPVWKFANPITQQKAETFLKEIQAKARPLPLVVASRDMECFQGCWTTEKTNGEIVDWFSTLGVSAARGA